MRQDDTYEFIGVWDEQYKRVGFESDFEGRPISRLIRCKDCKYWLPHAQFGFDEDNNEYHNYCDRLVPDDDYYAFTREADDFCSRAERKDNG